MMTVFVCEENFEAMMTCIYDAWDSRLGHRSIRLALASDGQQELFCEYRTVRPDPKKAEKVIRSISRKISPAAYRQVYMAAMSFEPDRLDAIYRFLLIGFAYGRSVTELLSHPAVIRILELSRKSENEAHFFREFTRFSSADGRFYVSHIEPKCNILSVSAAHFADRMPSEHWMIIDDGRRIAAVHPVNTPFYMTALSDEEFRTLQETENSSDQYTDLWKEFFQSIAIEARHNPKCQRNLMPLWYRKHMTEFR